MREHIYISSKNGSAFFLASPKIIQFNQYNFLFSVLSYRCRTSFLPSFPPFIISKSSLVVLFEPRGQMAPPDLDPRSSALDELHALLKSDKISKRKVNCRFSFLLADELARRCFLFFFRFFSDCKSRALTRFTERKRFFSYR